MEATMVNFKKVVFCLEVVELQETVHLAVHFLDLLLNGIALQTCWSRLVGRGISPCW